MSEITPKDAQEALGVAQMVGAFVGGIIAGVIALARKVYNIARRFEDVERKIDEQTESNQRLTSRVETLETVLPELMDREGVKEVFNTQVEMLAALESRLRQEMNGQYKNLNDRMDDIKRDLTEVNRNLFALVNRDKSSRAGDP